MADTYDVVIVGGGTAGVSAATTARRHYPDKKVLIVRPEEQTLIPCGIPYMFGALSDPLQNANPGHVLKHRGIGLEINRVTEIDREAREVILADGNRIGYDKLVLTMGSTPAVPPIPGRDKENVFSINKSLPYLQGILAALETATKVVIVGGGFIGVEMAEVIRKHRGLDVTIVEVFPYCLYTSFDEEIAIEAEQELTNLGVKILSGRKVEALTGETRVDGVQLADGTHLPADIVIMSTGVRPITGLAVQCGLALGPLGGVMVDRTMVTSDPNIFACGDCTEKFSFFAGNPVRVQLASIAAMEGRVAGANLFTRRRTNPGTVGIFSTYVGTKAFGCAGLTEKAAEDRDYEIIIGEALAPNQHPAALPGTQETKVKLVFDRYSGVLLGGQVVGGKCIGDLVNLLGACLFHKMTAMQMAAFQMGTHPMLTPSPAAYPLVVAAEQAACEHL